MKRFAKKRGFFVDKISEDSFYGNLLLGLPSFLKKSPFVTEINLERFPPATLQEVYFWEYRNGFVLPTDLRNFYISTNGFSFKYKFHYDKNDEEVTYLEAGIEFNPLSKLAKITLSDPAYLVDKNMTVIAPVAKIYHLTTIDENNWIVLAQFYPPRVPNIWLFHNKKIFYYFCEDTVTYFRMAISRLCVPGWQLSIVNANLPEWSSEMLQILAPGIYENQKLFSNKCELNKLDCDIFNITNDLKLTPKSPEEKVSEGGNTSRRKTPRNRLKK